MRNNITCPTVCKSLGYSVCRNIDNAISEAEMPRVCYIRITQFITEFNLPFSNCYFHQVQFICGPPNFTQLLAGSNFHGCTMQGAQFNGPNTQLNSVQFKNGCNLTGAIFTEIDFSSTTITGTDFTNSTFRNSTFDGIDFTGCTLGGTTFSKCTFKNLQQVDLFILKSIFDGQKDFSDFTSFLESAGWKPPIPLLPGKDSTTDYSYKIIKADDDYYNKETLYNGNNFSGDNFSSRAICSNSLAVKPTEKPHCLRI